MSNILGYEVEVCPVCEKGSVDTAKDTVVCSNCGTINKVTFLAKILNISQLSAHMAMTNGNYGPVSADAGLIAYNKWDMPINVFSEGEGPQYAFPTVFPKLPLTEDSIEVVDDPALLNGNPKEISFTGPWAHIWSSQLKGKDVTLRYSSRKQEVFTAAKTLEEVNCRVRVIEHGKKEPGKPLPELDPKVMDGPCSLEGVELKEVINNFHYTFFNGRLCYRNQINVPLHNVVDTVLKWFNDNGARFLWDEIDNVGYLLFRNSLYVLRETDMKLRSMLRDIGGVSKVTNEGRGILEGLCTCAGRGTPIKPEQWLKGILVKKTINIRQGNEHIIIKPNEITVEENDAVSYDMILGERKWFHPVELTDPTGGLEFLFEKFANYFAIPPVGREIMLCWILSAFMKDFSPVCPGMRVFGPFSTGKSTILQLLYWLFYGKPDMELPSDFTTSGLWRVASVEPLILMDNKNLQYIGEEVRTFLDVAATGGKRTMGVHNSNSAIDTTVQRARTLVIISGLDVGLHQDVRTRYLELKTDEEFKTSFYAMDARESIMSMRNTVLSAVFKLISEDILPTLEQYANADNASKYRKMLGTKERVVDYFLLMLAMGEALQKKGLIPEGDLGERWTTYIKARADESDMMNSVTLEWWKSFRIALEKSESEFLQFKDGAMVKSYPFKLIEKEGRITGIQGSMEELFAALTWAGSVLKRHVPWRFTREMVAEHESDKNAWRAEGWTLVIGSDFMVIDWSEV